MANILYANNAAGTLSAGITNVATSLTLNPGQAALFPAPVPPQVFYVTLTDAATQTLIEIVKVTAVAGNVFSIVRAQDGTSALSWNAGDIVSQRTIALELRGFENAAEGQFGAAGLNTAITPSSTLGIVGTVTSDNANAGSVGECIEPATVGPFTLASSTVTNLQILSLTAGDWDVQVTVSVTPQAGQTVILCATGISASNSAFEGVGTSTQTGTGTTSAAITASSPIVRRSLSTTTNVYGLVSAVSTGAAFMNASMHMRARRVR